MKNKNLLIAASLVSLLTVRGMNAQDKEPTDKVAFNKLTTVQKGLFKSNKKQIAELKNLAALILIDVATRVREVIGDNFASYQKIVYEKLGTLPIDENVNLALSYAIAPFLKQIEEDKQNEDMAQAANFLDFELSAISNNYDLVIGTLNKLKVKHSFPNKISVESLKALANELKTQSPNELRAQDIFGKSRLLLLSLEDILEEMGEMRESIKNQIESQPDKKELYGKLGQLYKIIDDNIGNFAEQADEYQKHPSSKILDDATRLKEELFAQKQNALELLNQSKLRKPQYQYKPKPIKTKYNN